MSELPPEMVAHYATGYEARRLFGGASEIERVRTQEIVTRYLPSPPAVVFDIGGGPGVYARWLARQGYEVHLVDVLPLHVELARQAAQNEPDAPLAEITLGDARQINRADASVDVALLFGPLYHLTQRSDRIAALREARRILRPGGTLFAAVISRYASLLDGLRNGFIADPEFVDIVRHDLTDGQHRNPTNHPDYFTTSVFHTPAELESEIAESGFMAERPLPVEGPLSMFDRAISAFSDPAQRETLLALLRQIEDAPSLLGCSSHLLAVARKPE